MWKSDTAHALWSLALAHAHLWVGLLSEEDAASLYDRALADPDRDIRDPDRPLRVWADLVRTTVTERDTSEMGGIDAPARQHTTTSGRLRWDLSDERWIFTVFRHGPGEGVPVLSVQYCPPTHQWSTPTAGPLVRPRHVEVLSSVLSALDWLGTSADLSEAFEVAERRLLSALDAECHRISGGGCEWSSRVDAEGYAIAPVGRVWQVTEEAERALRWVGAEAPDEVMEAALRAARAVRVAPTEGT